MYSFEKNKTDIPGLKYRPQLTGQCSDPDANHFPEISPRINPNFSKKNADFLLQLMKDKSPKSILEIGVAYKNQDWSTTATKILIENKSDDCFYLGVDLDDKSQYENKENLVFMHQGDSGDTAAIKEKLQETGGQGVDFLFIDGLHSVNQVLKDWNLITLLRPRNPTIILHDTNTHPGPVLLFDAIDENMFDKKKYCTDKDDYGISVINFKKIPVEVNGKW